VEGAPRAVTVLSQTCLEAGTLSTMAYLQGSAAAEFLQDTGAQFWIL
jgi:thiamine biosynthesis lipoprotein ApbE